MSGSGSLGVKQLGLLSLQRERAGDVGDGKGRRRHHQVGHSHVTVLAVLGVEQVEVELVAPPKRTNAVKRATLDGGELEQLRPWLGIPVAGAHPGRAELHGAAGRALGRQRSRAGRRLLPRGAL